ncbi:L-threonylcarbamoyladenylate synthase [Sandarakinorhabdus sp.]|uniref:L-threonylcarbamoyladenylate synthase n=1 Tax=Sandarakinorhabdus sp. TaxID=1916663 RepID=UPI00286E5A75|nr:L-threonylcarbamoyladenylate synthase [Sandarakinorhabdus sp.]
MTDKSRILAADADGIAAAAAVLRAGGIAAVPTETVYGLAARADDGAAVARIYEAKQRPGFNPLIVHVSGAVQAQTLVHVSPLAAQLMAAFWPGPLTLVLPRLAGAPVADLVSAGLPTLALRCPAHPVMQALIAAVGPLAAPSANASGRISPTSAAHVDASLGEDVGLILDGGPSAAGLESTIIAVENDAWTLLRPGAVPAEAIAAIAGPGRSVQGAAPAITAPGMLASHYAPSQPVRLGALTASASEFHVGFGSITGDANLSPTGDLTEAAARLFALLHEAQASGRPAIAVAPIPHHGLGAAINDRLRRAAAPRV